MEVDHLSWRTVAEELQAPEDKNWTADFDIHKENKILAAGILLGYCHIVVGIQVLDSQQEGIHWGVYHLTDSHRQSDQILILGADTPLEACYQESSEHYDIHGAFPGNSNQYHPQIYLGIQNFPQDHQIDMGLNHHEKNLKHMGEDKQWGQTALRSIQGDLL